MSGPFVSQHESIDSTKSSFTKVCIATMAIDKQQKLRTWWMASSLQLKQLVKQFITCRTKSMIAVILVRACVCVYANRSIIFYFVCCFLWFTIFHASNFMREQIPSNRTITIRRKKNLKINYRVQRNQKAKKKKTERQRKKISQWTLNNQNNAFLCIELL